jgi:hypothetical protein
MVSVAHQSAALLNNGASPEAGRLARLSKRDHLDFFIFSGGAPGAIHSVRLIHITPMAWSCVLLNCCLEEMVCCLGYFYSNPEQAPVTDALSRCAHRAAGFAGIARSRRPEGHLGSQALAWQVRRRRRWSGEELVIK